MIEIKKKTTEELDAILREILERETYIQEKDGDMILYEIYLSYDEQIGDKQLTDISKAEYPIEALDNVAWDWIVNAEDYYYPELLKTIEREIENRNDMVFEDYEDEIRDWVGENVRWDLPKSFDKQEVDVVISLDVGDMNYDFTCNDVLNWYGRDNEKNELDPNSPIKWLAKQQRKLTELKRALKEERLDQSTDFQQEKYEYSKFVKTTVQELQNVCSAMNTLIFLCKMSVKEFCELKELIKSEEELNKSYHYDERKGTKTFTISKNATCGLYDIWSGGGSVLEIELEKDVVIPTKAIFDIWIDCRGCNANGRGYDVADVYGICRSAFNGTVTINAA